MGLLFRTEDFLPGIEDMRTTTRYCKMHSDTSTRKEVMMLEAFQRNASKKEVQLGALEKHNNPDFPERKMYHQNSSRKKAQRGTSKKKALFDASKKRTRPGALQRKVYPCEKMVKRGETQWRLSAGDGLHKYEQ